MFRSLIAAVIFSVILIGPAHAAMPVEIVSSASDPIGERLVFALKERVRSSESLELTFDQSTPRLQIFIISIDPSVDNDGYSTAYSTVIAWKNPKDQFPYLLSQYVSLCGGSKVKDSADGIVAKISKQSDAIISAQINSSQP